MGVPCRRVSQFRGPQTFSAKSPTASIFTLGTLLQNAPPCCLRSVKAAAHYVRLILGPALLSASFSPTPWAGRLRQGSGGPTPALEGAPLSSLPAPGGRRESAETGISAPRDTGAVGASCTSQGPCRPQLNTGCVSERAPERLRRTKGQTARSRRQPPLEANGGGARAEGGTGRRRRAPSPAGEEVETPRPVPRVEVSLPAPALHLASP